MTSANATDPTRSPIKKHAVRPIAHTHVKKKLTAAISMMRLRSLFKPVVSRSNTTTHGTSDGWVFAAAAAAWDARAEAGTMTSGGLRVTPESVPGVEVIAGAGAASIAARRCAALLARCLGSGARVVDASLLGGCHARGASRVCCV